MKTKKMSEIYNFSSFGFMDEKERERERGGGGGCLIF